MIQNWPDLSGPFEVLQLQAAPQHLPVGFMKKNTSWCSEYAKWTIPRKKTCKHMTQPTNDCSVQNYRFYPSKGVGIPLEIRWNYRENMVTTLYIYISRYYMYVCMMQVYINVIQVDMYVCGDWWLQPLWCICMIIHGGRIAKEHSQNHKTYWSTLICKDFGYQTWLAKLYHSTPSIFKPRVGS